MGRNAKTFHLSYNPQLQKQLFHKNENYDDNDNETIMIKKVSMMKILMTWMTMSFWITRLAREGARSKFEKLESSNSVKI